MKEVLNNIIALIPVYRIHHREENLDFFRNVLGFKVLLEEGAMVHLGTHASKELAISLEESPELRAVKGSKKHQLTVIRAKSDEINQLILQNLTELEQVYQGSEGYAFEAISPENDHYLLTADENLANLKKIDKSEFKTSDKDEKFIGLTSLKVVELKMNVLNKSDLLAYYKEKFEVELHEDSSFDLASVKLSFEEPVDKTNLLAPVDEVFDLEFISLLMNSEADLSVFAERFEDKYLSANQKTLAVTTPQVLEFWFVK